MAKNQYVFHFSNYHIASTALMEWWQFQDRNGQVRTAFDVATIKDDNGRTLVAVTVVESSISSLSEFTKFVTKKFDVKYYKIL